jgi:hypothetical protein
MVLVVVASGCGPRTEPEGDETSSTGDMTGATVTSGSTSPGSSATSGTTLPGTSTTDTTGDASSGGADDFPLPNDVPPSERPYAIVVRIDASATVWAFEGDAGFEATAAALTADDRVLVADRHESSEAPSRLWSIDPDGVQLEVIELGDDVTVRDMTVDSAASRVLAAGSQAGAVGYWTFEETLAVLLPFVELYDYNPGQGMAVHIAASPDDAFVVAGAHQELEVRWVHKIAGNGDAMWDQPWPGTIDASPNSRPVGLAVGGDATIVVAIQTGRETEGGLGIDALDAAGDPAWGESIPNTMILGLAHADDGSFIAFGRDVETNDLALHAYTADGTPTWTRAHDVSSGGPMRACADDRFVLPLADSDTLGAVLFDGSGELLEMRTHSTDGELETTAAMCTSNGDVILVGRVTREL